MAHCGRPGLGNGVIDALVGALRDLGAGRLVGRVGPAICGAATRCRPSCTTRSPRACRPRRRRRGGARPASTSVAARSPSSQRLGVAAERLGGCTYEDPTSYSYRRDGVTGRHAGIAWRPRSYPMIMDGDRADGAELAANLEARTGPDRERPAPIAGRDPDEITLVVVTKTFPAERRPAARRASASPTSGENRDQEAAPKAAACADLDAALALRRPAADATRSARSRRTPTSCTPSTARGSSPRSTRPSATSTGRDPLDVLVQVDLDGEPGRGGVAPAEARVDRAIRSREAEHLTLRRGDGGRAARRRPGSGVRRAGRHRRAASAPTTRPRR